MVMDWFAFPGRANVPFNHRRMRKTSSRGNPKTKLSKFRTVSSLLESPQKNNHRLFKHSHASSVVKILNLQCAEYVHPLLSSKPTFPSHQAESQSSSRGMQTNLPSSRISHESFQTRPGAAVLVVEDGRPGLPVGSREVCFEEVAACTASSTAGFVGDDQNFMDLAYLELNGLPILRFRKAEDFRGERRLLVTWQSEILAFLFKQSQAFVWERWVQQWPRVGPDLQLWYTAFLQCVQGLGLLCSLRCIQKVNHSIYSRPCMRSGSASVRLTCDACDGEESVDVGMETTRPGCKLAM